MPEQAKRQTTQMLGKLMDGRLKLETRNGNPTIYARTYLQGKTLIHRTNVTEQRAAEKIATKWYVDLLSRADKGERLHDPTFADMAAAFLKSAPRDFNPGQVENFRDKWTLLAPYFGTIKPNQIDKKWLIDLRAKRALTKTKIGTFVNNSTLKKDLSFIRHVLRYAKEEAKCLDVLPEFPSFTTARWEIVPAPRRYFDKREFKTLLTHAWRRKREKGLNPRTRRQREELYFFILVCVGACLRVDEALSLRWRDCEPILFDEQMKSGVEGDFRWLLDLKVLGKHSRDGRREQAYGTEFALCAFKRMKELRADEVKKNPDAKMFQHNHRDGARELLTAAGLRVDADGRQRNLKSLRPTGITRLLDASEAPHYRDVAALARTSIAMVQDYYDQAHPEEAAFRVFMPRGKAPA